MTPLDFCYICKQPLDRHDSETVECAGLQRSRQADERVLGDSPQCEPEPAKVYFDLEVPRQQNGRIIFKAGVSREGKPSSIGFEINLLKLAEAELTQLRVFLERRHAGLTDGYEVVRAITWLLDLSLGQQQPELNQADRDTKVRKLLLYGQRG